MLIFSHFTFDNDGVKSSNRQVTFISLIFLLKFLTTAVNIDFIVSNMRGNNLNIFQGIIHFHPNHPQPKKFVNSSSATLSIATR